MLYCGIAYDISWNIVQMKVFHYESEADDWMVQEEWNDIYSKSIYSGEDMDEVIDAAIDDAEGSLESYFESCFTEDHEITREEIEDLLCSKLMYLEEEKRTGE